MSYIENAQFWLVMYRLVIFEFLMDLVYQMTALWRLEVFDNVSFISLDFLF